ncbi:S1C family serine protease [Marinomonas dokdonensis]|uniref:S1C family serine protease n=1 Tax=Marinomonas dokdonensis TaxID=328224 RepID=UPI00405568C6
MTQKTHWLTLIIAILGGACIGLSILLIQTLQSTRVDNYAVSVKKAAPAVVSIYTRILERNDFNKSSNTTHNLNLGSGVIITKQGFILTNHHVVQNAKSIIVRLNDGRRLSANIIGSDPFTDLAILKVPAENLPHIQIGSSERVNVGDRILAIGNPFDIGQTVTAGIISAKGRNSIGLNTYENFLQTDAAINPGNSGGALVNLKGQLIGISSAIYSSTNGSQGIGFATPVDDAMAVMTEIIKTGQVVRGYLGMDAQKITTQLAESLITPAQHGLLVSKVSANSPAEKAGIEVGDIIMKINDMESSDPHKVKNLIASYKPGTTISILGTRGNQSYKANITLEKQPMIKHLAQY